MQLYLLLRPTYEAPRCSPNALGLILIADYDNQLNSSLQCSSEHSTTTKETPHEVNKRGTRPDKIIFHSRQLTDETTPPCNRSHIRKLAVFCFDKIDFRSRQEQSCPTAADETTPYPTPISENSSANGCSRNFELFSFFSCFY